MFHVNLQGYSFLALDMSPGKEASALRATVLFCRSTEVLRYQAPAVGRVEQLEVRGLEGVTLHPVERQALAM